MNETPIERRRRGRPDAAAISRNDRGVVELSYDY